MAYINVDIEVDDFLDSCSNREIEQVKAWLYENNLEDEDENPVRGAVTAMDDTAWNNTVIRLLDKKWQLSKEDEETIIRIANQLL